MTPEELLGLARADDFDALGAEREAVADAVQAFVEAGDPASALELASPILRAACLSEPLEFGPATSLGRQG